MKRITKLSALALAILTLAGCDWFDGDDDDAPEPTPPEAESTFVRVHHTSADAPNVNVLVNSDAVLEDVPYQVSSQVLELDANTYEIQVDGILPNDEVAEAVIGPADLTFDANVRYEIFAVGSVADETLAPLVVESDPSAIEDGNIRVQAVHAAEGVPTVDVYVTAAEETPADSEAIATLEFGDDTGALDVAAGEYRVYLTIAGEPSQIAFDSGPLTLDAGADLILAAVLNTDAQSADFPVVLQLADGENTSILRSTDNGGDVRVVHAIADAPEVDILLNDEPSGIENLAYGSATDYVGLDADDYLIDVALNADGSVVIDDFEATIEAGESYSVYAIGSVDASDINLGVIAEDRRSVATEAQIQVVHASYSAGDVDVYLTESDDISEADPALTEVPFDINELVSSGNLSVAPGDYFVTVTATGTKTAAIGPLAVTLAAGGIYTAVAVDDEAGAPTIIALDDLAAE